MKSALQKEAERQALAMQIELSQHRQSGSFDFRKACRMHNHLPKWHTSYETLNGDFALDEVLAQEVVSRVVSSNPEACWLRDYLDGKLFDPSANFEENLGDVAVGPGNIFGNANAVRQAGEAAIAQSKINSAVAKISAGKAQSVKINSHMTLYNANESGRGRPRLRVKITRQPIKVFSSMLSETGAGYRIMSRGALSARAIDVKSMTEMQGLTSKMRFLNGKLGGGVLTFAPTVAFDLYDSVNRDANGNLHWNARQFANAELRNQPGNAVGMGAGALAAGIFAVAFGFAGAPLIIVGLGFGIGAQIIWNALDAPAHMPQIKSGGGQLGQLGSGGRW
jgi:hypothetical protein